LFIELNAATSESLTGVITIAVLLFLSGLISGSEIALFSLTRIDLENPKPNEVSRINMIIKLLEKPKKLLATILIANNLVNIGIVIVFSQISNHFLGHIESPIILFLVEVVVITFVILFFGEVLPKVYANRNKYSFSLKIIYPIYIFDFLFSPLSSPMRHLTIWIQNHLKEQKNNISVGQLSQALELTSTTDTSHEEQKILKGIVSFGNTDASQVMKPRIDIFSLDIEEKFEEIILKIVDNGFSRIPVYKENIDQIEGILFVKDLIPHIDTPGFNWTSLIRTPIFVPENKKLDDLLKTFQNSKNHLAIVVDEFGGTSGLISLEDIIEEIVGNISDEFDDVSINYSQLDEKTYLFEGKTSLRDFYRVLSIDGTLFEEKKGEAETLAGLILQINRSFPRKGQKITFDNYTFSIELMDNRRIKQIKVLINN
jgi:putative hemolysin